MKRTVFVHILLITLCPVIFVLAVIISTLHGILDVSVSHHALETVRLTATQISERATTRLKGLEAQQANASINMAKIGSSLPRTRQQADVLLYTMVELSPDAYSAWYVFEPGFLEDDRRVFTELIRGPKGSIKRNHTFTDELLDKIKWYQKPLQTGLIFYDALLQYDFGQGEGPISVLTIVTPIISNGEVVGCVGLNIRYSSLLRLGDMLTSDIVQKIMIVSPTGTILFSFDSRDIGKSLQNYEFSHSEELIESLHKKQMWLGETQSPFFEGKSLSILYPFSIHEMEDTVFLYRGVSRGQIFSKFSTSMDVIYLAGLLGTLLIAFCVFISIRKVISHIRRITANFRILADERGSEPLNFSQIPESDTHIFELDQLQSSLKAIMASIQEVHALKIKSVEAEVENQKLMATAQAKIAFFASISHEIRTPMNSIIGLAEIMLHSGQLSVEQQKQVNDIHMAADALLTIINDVLDVSKMESGKLTLQNEAYDFSLMVDNVASLSKSLAIDKGLDFLMEIDDTLPRCLYGDSSRVRQVLLNLLGNAIKYTPQGYVSLHISMYDGTLRFDVTDSGIGIAEKDLGTIFSTFTRVDSSDNKTITGTGLGLSICLNLVTLMGGQISVSSTQGHGSTFTVLLPAVLGDEARMQQLESTEPINFIDELRFLIVDDNPLNLYVSSGLLNVLCGIVSDVASSGMDAVAMVQRKDYDLVFMDHMMPVMDGVETTQAIRSLGGKFTKLPIIALTANAVAGTRELLLASGMDDFLTKPIQRKQLKDVLLRWIPQSKQTSVAPQGITGDQMEGKTAFEQEADVELVDDTEFKDGISRLESLSQVIGLNPYVGLENIGFDKDMYFNSLKLLAERIPPTRQLLHDYLALETIQDFQIQIHGLKGALLSVGVEELANQALALERAASRNDLDTCTEKMPEFVHRLDAFLISLAQAMQSIQIEIETSLELNNSEYDFVSLRLALGSHDYERIMEEWNVITAIECSDSDRELIKHLQKMIDNFDYSGAAALLTERLNSEDN